MGIFGGPNYTKIALAAEAQARTKEARTTDITQAFPRTMVNLVGYHPQHSSMLITLKKGGKRLRCHFDPKDFTEKYTAEYADVPVTGHSINPIQFKVARPRKWSMKLLFNELG